MNTIPPHSYPAAVPPLAVVAAVKPSAAAGAPPDSQPTDAFTHSGTPDASQPGGVLSYEQLADVPNGEKVDPSRLPPEIQNSELFRNLQGNSREASVENGKLVIKDEAGTSLQVDFTNSRDLVLDGQSQDGSKVSHGELKSTGHGWSEDSIAREFASAGEAQTKDAIPLKTHTFKSDGTGKIERMDESFDPSSKTYSASSTTSRGGVDQQHSQKSWTQTDQGWQANSSGKPGDHGGPAGMLDEIFPIGGKYPI